MVTVARQFLNDRFGRICNYAHHIHGIIGINHGREYPAPTLGQIIAYYKYQTTKQYNSTQDPICDSVGAGYSRPKHLYAKLWQRNYYEHIIRDEHDLNRIRDYIQNNVANWHKDKLNS